LARARARPRRSSKSGGGPPRRPARGRDRVGCDAAARPASRTSRAARGRRQRSRRPSPRLGAAWASRGLEQAEARLPPLLPAGAAARRVLPVLPCAAGRLPAGVRAGAGGVSVSARRRSAGERRVPHPLLTRCGSPPWMRRGAAVRRRGGRSHHPVLAPASRGLGHPSSSEAGNGTGELLRRAAV